MGLEFTGERYVPGVEGLENLFAEHMSRYMLAARFLDGGAVLDVGCGCGYGASYLASRGGGDVLGVDISPEAVGFAESRYGRPGLAFGVMDARSLALAGPFQVVTCFEVIEHVDDAPRVLAEISRVLAYRGVFLVSTPDKATYVAGGAGGTNPFHVREYTRGEFEELLRPVFPHVRLLDQVWSEGIMIGRESEGPVTSIDAYRLPDDQGQSVRPQPIEATYFVAACGRTAEVERAVDSMPPVFVDTALLRYTDLKRQAQKLRAEFDQRTAWAAKLNQEVHARDATIEDLKARLAAVEEAYDERGAWARGLSQELEGQRALVRQLAARVERLDPAKRTAATTL
jgi:SAM-dependent methyltransferase